MAGNTAGTIKKLTIGGVTYDVAFDVNATINYSRYETEGITSTGKTMYKVTIRSQDIEGLPILATPQKAANLKRVAETLADTSMSLTLADGSTLKGTGRINYENWETEENRHPVKLIPNRSKDAWTLFNP